MPIYDYECQDPKCGYLETDRFAHIDEQELKCPKCNNTSKRIISLSGIHCANDDAAWIRSVTEVVEKDPSCKASMQFLKNPTRTNYKRWLDAKNLRHVENVKGAPPEAFDRSKQQIDMERINKAVMERRIKRNTLHVR